MIVHKNEMRPDVWTNIHGGTGSIHVTHLLEADQMAGKCTLCARCVFQPGDSIGHHVHATNGEIYYVLEGDLVINEDGTEHTLSAGDVAFTANGASHSVVNKTDRPAVMLAVIMP